MVCMARKVSKMNVLYRRILEVYLWSDLKKHVLKVVE